MRPLIDAGRRRSPDPAATTTTDVLLGLQSSAGNRAVVGALMRDTKAPPKPPPRTTPGWTGADSTPGAVGPDDQVQDPTDVAGGWNAATVLVGSIWRVPIEGLRTGNKADFAEGERAKTVEPAAGRAIVLVHKDVDPKRPVSVLLHLHGYGFRSKPDDPYAGWRQFKAGKGAGAKAGTVRDVAHDRIQAQMTAAGNSQLIGILPQGVGRSSFGGIEAQPDAYIQEGLERAVAVLSGTKVLTEVPAERRLVLSAHSGGGDRVATTLALDQGRGLPDAARPVEVLLFDAIHVSKDNDWDGVAAVLAWVEHHLKRTSKALRDAKDDAARDAAVAACPVLRAYGSAIYKGTYERLDREMRKVLDKHKYAGRDAEVRARFRVEILASAGHEQIVRGLDADPAGGPLADALRVQGGAANATAPSKVTGASAPSQKAQRMIQRNAAFRQATTAGDAADRAAVAAALTASGFPDHMDWFAGVDAAATFLGLPITASTGTVAGVHTRFLTPLRAAERGLQRRYPNRSIEELREDLGLYSVSGLRRPLPASGGDGIPSLHCFGLAVDVNYAGNPFVGLQRPRVDRPEFTSSRTPKAIERAMWLIHGEAFDVEAPLPRTAATAGAAWDLHRRASDALVRYLGLAQDLEGDELAGLVAGAGQPNVRWNQPSRAGWWNDLAWWQGRMRTDWAVRDMYDFHAQGHGGKAETTGYMELNRDLVEELVAAGLSWGGQYQGAKDMMHFDLRGVINRAPA